MTNNIIFDFGDVFINLNKQGPVDAFTKMGLKSWPSEFAKLNEQFEVGAISETDFLNGFKAQLPNASLAEIKEGWNSILGDFPKYRLGFLKILADKYRIFLLSNTDAIHIAHFQEMVGEDFYTDFYACFEKVYFSFEIKDRKPNLSCYQHVISDANIEPDETLFVDDKLENILAAQKAGLRTWHLKVGKEDVIDLQERQVL
uniref:HAD family hydrolase n=1 Tax=Flavobacterium sp. TaxID=239 RepID=UPI00404A0AB3